MPTWDKVRHAFWFTRRRKTDHPMTPPLSHHERQIPTISISLESDDDLLQEHRSSKKTIRSATVSSSENRHIILGDETDQDDESTHGIQGRLDGNETRSTSAIDRQETLSSVQSSNLDDEHFLTRKQSKIGRLFSNEFALRSLNQKKSNVLFDLEMLQTLLRKEMKIFSF